MGYIPAPPGGPGYVTGPPPTSTFAMMQMQPGARPSVLRQNRRMQTLDDHGGVMAYGSPLAACTVANRAVASRPGSARPRSAVPPPAPHRQAPRLPRAGAQGGAGCGGAPFYPHTAADVLEVALENASRWVRDGARQTYAREAARPSSPAAALAARVAEHHAAGAENDATAFTAARLGAGPLTYTKPWQPRRAVREAPKAPPRPSSAHAYAPTGQHARGPARRSGGGNRPRSAPPPPRSMPPPRYKAAPPVAALHASWHVPFVPLADDHYLRQQLEMPPPAATAAWPSERSPASVTSVDCFASDARLKTVADDEPDYAQDEWGRSEQ